MVIAKGCREGRPGLRRARSSCLMGTVSVGDHDKASEAAGADGCTTAGMYLMSLNDTLDTAKIGSFRWCICCHNF